MEIDERVNLETYQGLILTTNMEEPHLKLYLKPLWGTKPHLSNPLPIIMATSLKVILGSFDIFQFLCNSRIELLWFLSIISCIF